MVTPASPESNSERYTAGDCVLEVRSQPSALSQWSARPIAQQLTFQLWLGVDGEKTDEKGRSLVAEGDRAALQSLAQYFQYQTQQVLAIASLNRSGQAASPSPKPPQSLQITTPLSYLQLADVTAVLGQYEQSARLLPVELRTVVSEQNLEAEPNLETGPNATNVVSLEEARRRSGRQPARRKRNSMWMSSAAAALFAVGLTSTLWLRDSSLQQLNTASESAAPAPRSESSQSEPSQASIDDTEADSTETLQQQEATSAGEPAPNSGTDTEIASNDAARREATTTTRPNRSAGAGSSRTGAANTTRQPAPSADSETSSPQDSVAEDAPVERQPDTDFSTAKRPDVTSPPPATVNEPSPPSVPESASPPAPAPEETQESTVEAARSPGTSESPAERSRVAESEVENVFTPPPSAGAPTAQTGGASRGQAPNRRQEEATVLRGSQEIPPESEDGNTAANVPEPDVSRVVGQVRTYFQQRWPADETSSLTYQLELSNTGDVLRFEGVDEVSRRERDRILPSDPSPSFAVGTLPQPITLRVFLLPNGDVQVLEL